MKFLSFMFTPAICTILNGYTQVNIKILLIQCYHTTCVSFSCEFMYAVQHVLALLTFSASAIDIYSLPYVMIVLSRIRRSLKLPKVYVRRFQNVERNIHLYRSHAIRYNKHICKVTPPDSFQNGLI